MMAKEKNSIPTRLPRKMHDDLDRALSKRFEKGLIKRSDLKLTEGLRLIGRMPEWQRSLERLKKEPKREDLI